MRITIKTKFIAMFAVLIAPLGVSSFLAVQKVGGFSEEIDTLADNTAVQRQMKAATARSISLVNTYLAQNDPEAAASTATMVNEQLEWVRNYAAEPTGVISYFEVNDLKAKPKATEPQIKMVSGGNNTTSAAKAQSEAFDLDIAAETSRPKTSSIAQGEHV